MKAVQVLKNYLAVVPVVALLLTGCSASERSVDDSKVRVKISNQMDAQDLAEAAEQLFSPTTFMLSYRTALMALEKDPSNLKAQFYAKLLKRFEAFRGMGVRVKAENAGDQKKLNEYWARFPKSPLKDFIMTTGGAEVKDAATIQDVLSEYFAATSEFRDFLKQNEAAELEIRLNPVLFQDQLKKDMSNNCVVIEMNSSKDYVVECDYSSVATKKLNMADLVVLRQLTAGELLYSVLNNYTLNGVEVLRGMENASARQRTEALLAQPSFGRLRKNHMFSLIKSIGSDYSAAAKWALQNQSSLCPKGYGSLEIQRKGYLVQNGLCVNPAEQNNMDRAIATMDQAIAGVTQNAVLNPGTPEELKVNMNLFAIFNNPMADLRQIAPTAWNKCDNAAAIKDNTFGGTFVDGDLNNLLSTQCK